MKAPCMLRVQNGIWSAHHRSAALGTAAVTARSREEALNKMQNELQYRIELCPCSGVSGDTVVVEVQNDGK